MKYKFDKNLGALANVYEKRALHKVGNGDIVLDNHDADRDDISVMDDFFASLTHFIRETL